MGNKIIILPEDVVLTPETKVLYKSDNGKYYLNEEGAREKLATHFKCNYGNGIREKFRIYCDNCEPPKKEYFKEWDLKTPVYCNTRDKYFFSLDELTDFMHEEELTSDDLDLSICEPNYFNQVDSDIWEDVLAEDADLPSEIQIKLDELNAAIKNHGKPASWSPSKYKTKFLVKE